MTIALVHFFFNLISVVVIYGIKWLRVIPLVMAEKLAELAAHKRIYAFVYLLLAFFILPGLIILIAA